MITVLIGKSGSGKTTIAKALEKMSGFERIVTYTTRKPRQGEIEGKDYHFVSDSEFNRMIHDKELMEYRTYDASFGRVSYGSAKKDYDSNSKHEKVIVLNPDGVLSIIKNSNLDDTQIRFIYLEVDENILVHRLKSRGDDPKEIQRRLESDEKDLERLKRGCKDRVWYLDVSEMSLEGIVGLISYAGIKDNDEEEF